MESVWILVGVAGVLTIASHVLQRRQKTDARTSLYVWLCAMLFLVWTILSYIYSSTANYGLDEVLRDAALILVFLWTMREAQSSTLKQFVQRFAMTMVIAMVLAIAFGVLVYALQPVNRFVGTFFDYRFHTDYWPNAWAQFLLLAWPMILLVHAEASRPVKMACTGVLGVVFGALLLSFSRGALIAYTGQVFLLAAWCWLKSRSVPPEVRRQRADIIALPKIILLAVIAIGMFFSMNALRAGYHPVQSVSEKITFSADEGGSSVSERAQFWSQSLTLTSHSPLFGWGPYSFRFLHQRLQTGVLETSDHPHNLFLKIVVERGVPAGMFLLLLLLYILVPVVKRAFADVRLLHFSQQPAASLSGQTMEVNTNHIFLAVAVLGVLAHNLIDYNLQFVGIALPFWMMLGLLAGGSVRSDMAGVRITNKKFAQISELILAIILILVAFYEGVFLITSSMGRHAEVRGDDIAALRWYHRSAGEFFSRDMHLSSALLGVKHGEVTRAQDAIVLHVKLNPEDPRGWRLLGDIAKKSDNVDLALDAYAKAYDLGRWNDLSISLAMMEILVEQKSKDHSLVPLEAMKPEIDVLLNAYVDAIIRNAHYIALSHNAEDAIALANLLAHAFPKDAPRYEVLAAKADHAMRTERSKLKSRPAGYLW